MIKTLELPVSISDCAVDYCINDSKTLEVLPTLLTIKNKFSLELICKLGPSATEYSGWIHISIKNRPKYSIFLQIQTAVATYTRLMEGETSWLRLDALQNPEFRLFYSNPSDFNQPTVFYDGIVPDSLRIQNQIAIYGFEAGNYRRHIRL